MACSAHEPRGINCEKQKKKQRNEQKETITRGGNGKIEALMQDLHLALQCKQQDDMYDIFGGSGAIRMDSTSALATIFIS